MGNIPKLFSLTVLGISFLSLTWGFDCSNVLSKGTRGLLSYRGKVEFPAPHNFTGQWVVEMDTDVEFTFLGGYRVWVSSDPEAGTATFTSRTEDNEIHEGDLITFSFRISWFRGETEPEVVSMIWDGDQICADDGTSFKEIKRAKRQRRNPEENDADGRTVYTYRRGTKRFRVNRF